ncbi:DUF3693 domain-containing protein (plasmid) [Photobacterium sp. DA100]|uniref:DUF3693 domain-containing protein n=1 Tax=Photobacterium sp. DA100 TaxID=3027472 RepID=UPI002478BB4B|nr:DUF3693 domain-containing protein [Photobacterium sp. DA100]WEM45784.1 DUF3693 domain-containing protein [Photobacterium sp. DA100]
MYANKLLDAYKTSKNYIQDKQIAHDLDISPQKISKIRKGERYLTDSEAIFLAESTNIDPHEALIFLAADKAKDVKAQKLWQDITAKLSNQGFRGLVLGLTGFLALVPTIPQYALCILC